MLSMTSLTGPGGFCIDFTSEMSAGFRVSSAVSAASSAGMASARSPSHSFYRQHRDRKGECLVPGRHTGTTVKQSSAPEEAEGAGEHHLPQCPCRMVPLLEFCT